jgi:hypothetical protein
MGNDRRQREELHRDYLTAPETKSPYIELSGQRNQQVTTVNLRLPDSNRPGGIFLLGALVSTSSPPATAWLLCSTRSGVTCRSVNPVRKHRTSDGSTNAHWRPRCCSTEPARKSPNKTRGSAEEEMEGRGLAKGNLSQQNAPDAEPGRRAECVGSGSRIRHRIILTGRGAISSLILAHPNLYPSLNRLRCFSRHPC